MNIENDYIGFLTTIVSTANGALPVRNANVTIYISTVTRAATFWSQSSAER